MLAGIELGGTKVNCVLGNEKGEIHESHQFLTRSPQETIQNIKKYFSSYISNNSIDSIGVACFGPLELDQKSTKFGSLKVTPKVGWNEFPILSEIQKVFPNIPVNINTDVNGAALAESMWGIGRKVKNFTYITIGTGIGGAIIINNQLHYGNYHSEIGHIIIPKFRGDEFLGLCNHHQACWEGLASGPAIEARWGEKPDSLDSQHPAWDLEAKYAGYAIANLYFAVGVDTFVLGGGVMKQEHLFAKIQLATEKIINNYGASIEKKPPIISVIPSKLTPSTGMVGTISIAFHAYVKNSY
jgi:fructokinase